MHLKRRGKWRQSWMGTCTQQAETEGDKDPIGRGRWRPNRQRQMGAYIQQAEPDGNKYSTGRDSREEKPTGTPHT